MKPLNKAHFKGRTIIRADMEDNHGGVNLSDGTTLLRPYYFDMFTRIKTDEQKEGFLQRFPGQI